MRRLLVLFTVPLLLLAAGCGGSSSSSSGGAKGPTATVTPTQPPRTAPAGSGASATDRYGCQAVSRPQPRAEGNLHRPTLKLSSGRRYTVVLQTSCGPISIRLDVAQQPRTAASFAYLVRRHFYDGLTFHRISHLPDGTTWVIQGGDPLGTGEGGPGYSITETPPRHARYTFGTVAMAKTGTEPNGTSGSQFFIVTVADAQLPAQYALVGQVTGSTAAVRRIASIPSDPQTEQPLVPVVIQHATLRTGG